MVNIVERGTDFVLRVHSYARPHGNKLFPGARRSSGYTEADIPDASTERDHKGTSEFSRVLLKCIPGTQSVRKVASSDRSKKTERTHFRTSPSYVRYKLISEYHQKKETMCSK